MFNYTLEGGEGGGGLGGGGPGGVPPLLLRCTAVLIHPWAQQGCLVRIGVWVTGQGVGDGGWGLGRCRAGLGLCDWDRAGSKRCGREGGMRQ